MKWYNYVNSHKMRAQPVVDVNIYCCSLYFTQFNETENFHYTTSTATYLL